MKVHLSNSNNTNMDKLYKPQKVHPSKKAPSAISQAAYRLETQMGNTIPVPIPATRYGSQPRPHTQKLEQLQAKKNSVATTSTRQAWTPKETIHLGSTEWSWNVRGRTKMITPVDLRLGSKTEEINLVLLFDKSACFYKYSIKELSFLSSVSSKHIAS